MLNDQALREKAWRYGLENGFDQCGERRRHNRREEGKAMGLEGTVRNVI